MESDKLVLDPCCGSRMIWYDKENPIVCYGDIRSEEHTLCDGRKLVIEPDILLDYTRLPFPDETFWHIAFDPSHLKNIGSNAWMALKYGKLLPSWETDIKGGFDECLRVLKTCGTLNFKWNEQQIPFKKILEVIEVEPLYTQRTGKNNATIWMSFLKIPVTSNKITTA